jgi:hypothetical protein
LTILVRRSSEYGFMLYMITRSAMWVNGYGVCCRYTLTGRTRLRYCGTFGQ